MNTREMLRHPSAFLPVLMSLAALSIVLAHLVINGPAPQRVITLALQVGGAIAALLPVYLLRW